MNGLSVGFPGRLNSKGAPSNLRFQREKAGSVTPILRQVAATEVPLSTEWRVATICSCMKLFFMVWFSSEYKFGICPFLTFRNV